MWKEGKAPAECVSPCSSPCFQGRREGAQRHQCANPWRSHVEPVLGCGSHPGRSANLQRVHFLSLPIMVPHLSEIGTKLRTKSPACSTIWIARAGVTKYGTVARPAEIWLINLAAVILRTFGAAISAICDFCRHTNARTRLHEQMTTSMLTRLESLWQGSPPVEGRIGQWPGLIRGRTLSRTFDRPCLGRIPRFVCLAGCDLSFFTFTSISVRPT